MTMRRISSPFMRRRLGAAATIVVAAAAALSAHDFWIEPSAFNPAVGDIIRVHLRVGDHFVGEPVGRNDAKIEKFFVASPTGDRPVVGRNGADPAGVLRIDQPGTWIVAYRGRPSRVELAPAAFEQYLREEGLEGIVDDRRKRSEAQRPGRENFSRSVKALLRAGGGPTEGFDRVLGLALELVPEQAPWTLTDTRLPIRLLADGKPLAGALIVSVRQESGGKSGEIRSRVRSDQDGRAVVEVGPGMWMVKAVNMQRMEETATDWSSVWTSLTFAIPK